jgi:hypothetical protein
LNLNIRPIAIVGRLNIHYQNVMLRFFSGCAIGLIAILYIIYNYYFSVNFPFQDDFLLIQFVETVTSGSLGVWDVTRELFRTFNDHKAVIPRLISLIEYSLTGHLNFRFYIVLVTVNVLYIFYFLYLQFRKSGLPLYYFLPASFLFFQPQFYEVSGWALNGMQHTFLIAFTASAIILISRGKLWAFYVAMLCCFLATFTHGNGILSFLSVIFYFLCLKDFKKAGWAAFFMALCLLIYLIGYESGQAVHLPTSLGKLFVFLFSFVGFSMSIFASDALWSVLWGVAIVALMFYLVIKIAGTYYDKPVTLKPGSLELLTFFVFIFATALVVSIFRSWSESSIASRFQIYAALSSVTFYLLMLDYSHIFRRRAVLLVVTGLGALYCGYSYYKFTGTVASRRTAYLADVYNWKNNKNMFSVERSLLAKGDFYLLPAYEKGVFRLPKPIIDRDEMNAMYYPDSGNLRCAGIRIEDWKVIRSTKNGEDTLNYFFVSADSTPKRKRLLQDRLLILKLRGKERFYLMQANPKTESRRHVITGGSYFKTGFLATLRQDDLDVGTYELAMLDVGCFGDKSIYRFKELLYVGDDGHIIK